MRVPQAPFLLHLRIIWTNSMISVIIQKSCYMGGEGMNSIVYAGKHFLTFAVNRHQHSNWELVYCTGKSGVFVFDGIELAYSVGDIVIIPPETPHCNMSENGFTNIHLNMNDAMLPYDAPLVVHDDANQSILHLFSDAYYLYCRETPRRTELLKAYGSLIVQFMIANRSAHPGNRITEQIEQSIVQNYADANYEMDALLSSLPYCSDYLCRVFRKEKGVTPHKYLTQLRLQSAANLLTSPQNDTSISEIALMCGFRNPLYFSRLFKKRYGVSPTAYAAQLPQTPPAGSVDPDSQKIPLE